MTRYWTPLLVTVLLGCSDSRRAPGVVVTDSLGVSIVQNGVEAMSAAALWSLEDTPSTEIESSGDVVLFRVRATQTLPTGEIAVLNAGSNQVLVFERDGALRRTMGGEGDGPGEFRLPTSLIQLPVDSIGVYDTRSKRFSVFTATGEFARDFTVDRLLEGTSYDLVYPLNDGLAAFTNDDGFGSEQAPSVYRADSESIALGLDGSFRSSLGRFPGAEMFIGGPGGGRLMFGAVTLAATTSGEFIVGTAEAPEIRAYSPTGDLIRIVRWPDADRTVTEERIETMLSTALAAVPPQAHAQMRTVFRTLPISPTEPAYGQLLASNDSKVVWVGGYQGPEMAMPGTRSPVHEWLVFDHEGSIVARLETPLGFQALAVSEDEVVGVFVDELGVESVRAYALIR